MIIHVQCSHKHNLFSWDCKICYFLSLSNITICWQLILREMFNDLSYPATNWNIAPPHLPADFKKATKRKSCEPPPENSRWALGSALFYNYKTVSVLINVQFPWWFFCLTQPLGTWNFSHPPSLVIGELPKSTSARTWCALVVRIISRSGDAGSVFWTIALNRPGLLFREGLVPRSKTQLKVGKKWA